MLTARDAADRGAEIHTRSRAVEIRQVDGIWHVTVENTISGTRTTIQARALVNAGGPWVEQVLSVGLRRQRARKSAAGAGLAHRGAQAL